MRFLPTVIVALATAVEITNAQRVHRSHGEKRVHRSHAEINNAQSRAHRSHSEISNAQRAHRSHKQIRGADGTNRRMQKGGGGGGGGGVVGGGGGGGTKSPPTAAPVDSPTDSSTSTNVLTNPSEFVSGSDNTLFETIWIEQATFTIPGSDWTVTSRLLNGEYPGPTLRIKPGDTLDILYENDLVDLGKDYVHNEYSGNDISNMHFHGLHVSGELPSDDVTYKVYPGESYNYITTLPDEHMPGTHWQHPHVHGSTSLQVGGGALQAIIVEDPDGYLPDQIADATEVLFLAHYWNMNDFNSVLDAEHCADTVFSSDIDVNEFVTVNGQYQPVINIDAGEWVRFRVIWGNFLEGDLDLGISGCDMNLLAKDGIYIQDYPRSLTDFTIPAGGRADIMVRCPDPSTTYTVSGIVDGMATIVTSATTQSSTDLEPFPEDFTYPNYLTDLTDSGGLVDAEGNNPSTGCSCDTVFSGADNSVNSIVMPEEETYLHQTYIGAIAERALVANAHPYHQHVYPFQILDSSFGDGYYKAGDWHDVIKGTGSVRFRPTEFTGLVMLHCHRLVHEDLGMMAMETVESTGGSCYCTSRQGTVS